MFAKHSQSLLVRKNFVCFFSNFPIIMVRLCVRLIVFLLYWIFCVPVDQIESKELDGVKSPNTKQSVRLNKAFLVFKDLFYDGPPEYEDKYIKGVVDVHKLMQKMIDECFVNKSLITEDKSKKPAYEDIERLVSSVTLCGDEWMNTVTIKTLKKTLYIRESNNGYYGCEVYEPAKALAQYMDLSCLKNKACLKGKKILELGAGTGIVSLVAASFGGNVYATDSFEILPCLQRNIDLNTELLKGTGGKIRAEELRWGDIEQIKSMPKPDVILMSNLIYIDGSLDSLVYTLDLLAQENTTLLLFNEDLNPGKNIVLKEFYDLVKEHFKFSKIPNKKLIRERYHENIMLKGERLENSRSPDIFLN